MELLWQLLCHMIIFLFLWDKKHLLKYTICHPHRTELSAFLLSFQGKSLLERWSASASPCQFLPRLLLFKNGFCINFFLILLLRRITIYETIRGNSSNNRIITSDFSIYSTYWTVGLCLYHVKTSSQSLEYWKTLQFLSSLSSAVIVCRP